MSAANNDRVCFKWQEGNCAYGASCRFLHGNEPTRGSQQKATQICYEYRDTGSCKFGDSCKFAHGAAAAAPAPAGGGKRGGGAAAASAAARAAPVEKKRVSAEELQGVGRLECRLWKQSGRCEFGDNCRFVHSRADGSVEETRGSRTKSGLVCFTFRDTGSCKFGQDCRYQHGAAQPA